MISVQDIGAARVRMIARTTSTTCLIGTPLSTRKRFEDLLCDELAKFAYATPSDPIPADPRSWARSRIAELHLDENDPDRDLWFRYVHDVSEETFVQRRFEARRQSMEWLPPDALAIVRAVLALGRTQLTVRELCVALGDYRDERPADVTTWARRHLWARLSANVATLPGAGDVELEQLCKRWFTDTLPPAPMPEFGLTDHEARWKFERTWGSKVDWRTLRQLLTDEGE